MASTLNTEQGLRLDWATAEAARHACTRWHYSGTVPVGKLVKVGAWEDGRFIGVVLFSWGANNRLGSPYGLPMQQCCELVRVALRDHKAPVSRIVAIALRFLRKQSPGLRLVVSYADPAEGHHGGIYQAGGWLYSGRSSPTFEYWHNGQRLHKRAYTGANYGKPKLTLPPGTERRTTEGKHRYLMPLDADMRARLAPLAQPYPKRNMRAKQATDAPSIPAAV